MDNSLKIQLDVKNNAQELQKYMLDLNNWEEEMKRKEMALLNEKPKESLIPPPRNKIKRNKPENEKKCAKAKKISAYDYSAWDKFDVEKALAEIDNEDTNTDETEEAVLEENIKNEVDNNKCNDSEFKDNGKFSLVDEAFYEKEMGNQFVKKEQWTDAIKCYTNAINLDSNNAIYYANRSLCFLKLKNFKSAETDATTAIQLDKNYVKAYQRRAFTRLALGQLKDAKSDYEEILRLEPKNALARVEIYKINEKLNKELGINKTVKKEKELCFNPKNMFENKNNKSQVKQSVDFSKKQHSNHTGTEYSKNATVVSKPKSKTTLKNTTEFKKGDNNINKEIKNEESNFERGDGDKMISTQPIRQKCEVFKPLPEWCKIIQPVNILPHKRSTKPLRRIEIKITDKDENFDSMVETKNELINVVEEEKYRNTKNIEKEENKKIFRKNEEEELNYGRLTFDVPKTAIQFQNSWKILKKSPEDCYSYLKKIPTTELPQIFENSLESDFFSQIVTFLASDEIKKDPEFIYNFLLGLSKVKRFSSLILFMSEADKKCIRKAISETEKVKSAEDLTELLRLFELKH